MLISSISDVDRCYCQWIENRCRFRSFKWTWLALGPQKSMVFGVIVRAASPTRPNEDQQCRPYRPEVCGAWVEFVARGRVCSAWFMAGWSKGAWPDRILDKPLPKILGLTVKG
jgi:hypothetical protein